MQQWLDFYWRCFRLAFSGAWGFVSAACTVLGIVAAAITDKHPDWMNADTIKLINSLGGWIVPLALFSSLLIGRLFFWAPYALYRDAINKPDVDDIVGAVTPTTKAAPLVNPQSSITGNGPSAQIMEQIRQIKSPMQQKEFAKTFIGKPVDWLLFIQSVNIYDQIHFTLILKEREIVSLDLMFLISVDVPIDGYDYLRFADRDQKVRVIGKISRIDVSGSYIYIGDASVTQVS